VIDRSRKRLRPATNTDLLILEKFDIPLSGFPKCQRLILKRFRWESRRHFLLSDILEDKCPFLLLLDVSCFTRVSDASFRTMRSSEEIFFFPSILSCIPILLALMSAISLRRSFALKRSIHCSVCSGFLILHPLECSRCQCQNAMSY